MSYIPSDWQYLNLPFIFTWCQIVNLLYMIVLLSLFAIQIYELVTCLPSKPRFVFTCLSPPSLRGFCLVCLLEYLAVYLPDPLSHTLSGNKHELEDLKLTLYQRRRTETCARFPSCTGFRKKDSSNWVTSYLPKWTFWLWDHFTFTWF